MPRGCATRSQQELQCTVFLSTRMLTSSLTNGHLFILQNSSFTFREMCYFSPHWDQILDKNLREGNRA